MFTPAVSAKEVSGVNFLEQMKISGKNMVLNGAGLRKKAFIKVYACGLYLKEKNSDSKAIISADEPMAVKLVITTGLVTKEKMQEAMTEGFEASTNGNQATIQDSIDLFNNCFNDEIVKGDEFMMAYLPGTGVVVSKNGTEKGIIEGLDFKKALIGIWLGDNPIDKGLKKDML